MTDEEFLLRFENAALPRQEWNHAAHLRMAFLYLNRSDSWQTILPLVRERIQRFNAAHRNYSGYHETITVSFLRILHHRLSSSKSAENVSFESFAEDNLDLFAGLSVLLRHYDRKTLLSPEARAGFVEPDREPLP